MAESSPELPRARGPLSRRVLELVRGSAKVRPALGTREAISQGDAPDPCRDDDLQLALYVCYELHYRGFAGVEDDREWDVEVLAERRRLERTFECALRAQIAHRPIPHDPAAVLAAVQACADRPGPSLSAYMARQGTRAQFHEFAIHRSLYQLKEADPHTWAIPRVTGSAKTALAHIQAGEYGEGEHEANHARMFGHTMVALGLDPTYGAYLDLVPAPTLATVNLVSMFGLRRRFRGALLGHLAVFEMTSVEPMGRYATALARLGVDERARGFYLAHVEADAHHAVVAGEMVQAAVRAEPCLAPDVVFGAEAVVLVEQRFAEHLLGSWACGTSSLRSAA